MKHFILLAVASSLALPLIADMNFNALVELEQAQSSHSKKVDLFVLSSIISSTSCDSLYVRETHNVDETPAHQEEIAQVDEPILHVPSAPPSTPETQPMAEEFFAQNEPFDFEEPQFPVNEDLAPCRHSIPLFTNLYLQAGPGYRRDNLWWTNDHLHHEFGLDKAKAKDHLKDIDILLLGVAFRGNICSCLYLRGYADYGWVMDGEERQKDIFKLKNKLPVSSSSSSSSEESLEFVEHSNLRGSNITDFSIAIGIPFQFTYHSPCCNDCGCCDCCNSCSQYPRFTLNPLGGISYNSMHLTTRHSSLIEVPEIPLGPPYYEGFHIGKQSQKQKKHNPLAKHAKPSLHKKFEISNWTPFIGADFTYRLCCVEIFGDLEFHYGRAHWRCSNRIPSLALWQALHEVVDFKSKHSQAIAGVRLKTGVRTPIFNCWFCEVNVGYQDFSTCKNDEIHWQSFEVNLQIGRIF